MSFAETKTSHFLKAIAHLHRCKCTKAKTHSEQSNSLMHACYWRSQGGGPTPLIAMCHVLSKCVMQGVIYCHNVAPVQQISRSGKTLILVKSSTTAMQPTAIIFLNLRSCQMTPLVFTAVLYSCKYSTFKPQYNEVSKIGNMLRYTENWPFKRLSTVANGFLLHWSGCEISCHVEDIFTSVGTTKWSQLRLCSVADSVVCSGMTLLWEAAAVGS